MRVGVDGHSRIVRPRTGRWLSPRLLPRIRLTRHSRQHTLYRVIEFNHPEGDMSRRRPNNPLALAVLTMLYEHPMHPYEMSRTLRERGKEASIRLNHGSLYSVVD